MLLDLFNNVPPSQEQIRQTAMAANAAGDVADAYSYMAEYHLMSADLPLAINQLELALSVPNLTDVQRQRFVARLAELRQNLPKERARLEEGGKQASRAIARTPRAWLGRIAGLEPAADGVSMLKLYAGRLRPTLIVLAVLLCAGCASTKTRTPSDPIEPANRGVYKFNDALDRDVLKPTAKAYRQGLAQLAEDRHR